MSSHQPHLSLQLEQVLLDVAIQEVRGSTDVRVSSICSDTRYLQPGGLFAALRGNRYDGHKFIEQAINKGAAVILSEEDSYNIPSNVTSIRVSDTRAALPRVAANFYDHPSRKMKVAGVTGTNGKTTTTCLIKYICDSVEFPCGYIGTLGNQIRDKSESCVFTTPDSTIIQNLLARMYDEQCKAVAIEASSHGLELKRVYDVEFDAAIFTNFTQDHLDFHGTMEKYFEAKASFFNDILPNQREKTGTAIINIDDPYGPKICSLIPDNIPIVTYGFGEASDYRADGLVMSTGGSTFDLHFRKDIVEVNTTLIGKYNVYNTLGALAAVSVFGIPLKHAIAALKSVPIVPGRLEPISSKHHFKVYVDFAHTEDALNNVLGALRDLGPSRVIVVFGCSGGRDKSKRPLMGRAAEQGSDYAIITSDNPRSEDPLSIARDVERGFVGTNYDIIIDRQEAIERSVQMARAGDIVVIAGKGHESTQERHHETVPFSDIHVARMALDSTPILV